MPHPCILENKSLSSHIPLMDVCLWQPNTSTPERSPDTCMAESRRLEIHCCFPQHHNLIYHETWKTWSASPILLVIVG